MSLILVLVTFRGYFLSRAMYDSCLIRRSLRGHCIQPPQGRTRSTSNCSTHVHLIRSYTHPAMVSPSGDLHRHATILTMCLFLLMSHLYFLYPSLITLFLNVTHSEQYHISSFLYALATYIKSVWNLI